MSVTSASGKKLAISLASYFPTKSSLGWNHPPQVHRLGQHPAPKPTYAEVASRSADSPRSQGKSSSTNPPGAKVNPPLVEQQSADQVSASHQATPHQNPAEPEARNPAAPKRKLPLALEACNRAVRIRISPKSEPALSPPNRWERQNGSRAATPRHANVPPTGGSHPDMPPPETCAHALSKRVSPLLTAVQKSSITTPANNCCDRTNFPQRP